MNLQLPNIVQTYFQSSNDDDASRVVNCFCAHDIVTDEKVTHHGPRAIETWCNAARRSFSYRVEPLRVAQRDDSLVVIASVAGNFPGSPVDLSYAFQLENGLILSLEITP
jgi:hypothetical protein